MKRIVLCCDGTWNRADQEREGVPCPTNVVKLANRIAKRAPDGVVQVVYYDHGVGTGNSLDRLSGGAFGDGLEENIHDAYRFLIANYEPGDEIFLFGFSRGAFTVRSLGGLVRKCGILRRSSLEQYRAALALYRSDQHPSGAGPAAFRSSHCLSGADGVKITMVGVWDTVGALGIPMRGLRWLTRGKHRFHDTELSSAVQHGYHALAIDERRAPFEPTLWFYKPKPGQFVEQLWFAGAHSDVGGGYAETGLSDIPLGWMIEKAEGVGLAFDRELLTARALAPDHRAPVHESRTGLYRLTRADHRQIGERVRHEGGTGDDDLASASDPTQQVHQSALDRWDEDSRYRPPGLRAFLAGRGDPRSSG